MTPFLFLLLVTVVNSESLETNFEKYSDLVTLNTELICWFLEANVTRECREQLNELCANPTLLWAIFDSSAKFPYSGLTYSSQSDFGNFDQCFSLDHSYSGGRILGEYCTVGLIIPNFLDITALNFFSLAVCRPDKCMARDYNAIVNSILFNSSSTVGLYVDGLCVTKESAPFTNGDIAVITVFGIFILLMVLSTLYDVCLGNKKGYPLYLAFSVLSNGRKLLHISRHSTSKENVEVLHGVRVISMIWIVAGHAYVMWDIAAVTNLQRVEDWKVQVSSFYITAAPLAVDTFFYMSGFLLAFQYFKREIKKSVGAQVRSIPYMIIYRYLRLTPVLLMLYLMAITFFVHLGSGPMWHSAAELLANNCEKYWWRFFLYIQNYVEVDDMCMLHTWYLSADMQLFLISPLIFIPISVIYNKFGFGHSVVALLFINIIWTILPMMTKLLITEYTNEYDTHSRLINYFLGAMMGFFMRVRMDKPFLYMLGESQRFKTNLITWLVVLLGMMAIIVCYQDQLLNHGFESIQVFQSLMRPAWCIGLSWVTYSCYHGQGGFINWILCRPIFQILGRLTYSIYLLHAIIIGVYFATLRTKLFYTDFNAFYLICGHYAVTIILSLFWTLAFESPLIVIEKHLLGHKRTVKQQQDVIEMRNGNIEEGFKSNEGRE